MKRFTNVSFPSANLQLLADQTEGRSVQGPRASLRRGGNPPSAAPHRVHLQPGTRAEVDHRRDSAAGAAG